MTTVANAGSADGSSVAGLARSKGRPVGVATSRVSREPLLFETITSSNDLARVVGELCMELHHRAQERFKIRDSTPRDIWFRGHAKSSYRLLPSLHRFARGQEVEGDLFREYAKLKPTSADPSWDMLFEMQHFFIPTRLLDWTARLDVAVFFATSAEDAHSPTLFLLHPKILNHFAQGRGLLKSAQLATVQDLPPSYQAILNGGPVCWPAYPIAIDPPKGFARLKVQSGRFTLHSGRSAGVFLPVQPLDEICPEAVAEVRLPLDRAKLIIPPGLPQAHDIFPDETGIALSLREKFGLKADPERRIRSGLMALLDHDRKELRKGPTGRPSTPGIKGCVIDSLYVEREESEQLDKWLSSEVPLAVVTGPAAAGKTNLLVNHFLGRQRVNMRPVLLYSLVDYRPHERSLFAGMATFLTGVAKKDWDPVREDALVELVAGGAVVLVLDGLDEIARTQGEPIVRSLDAEIRRLTSGANRPKIVIACRDHIFRRLQDGEHFQNGGRFTLIPLKPLDPGLIQKKLAPLLRAAISSRRAVMTPSALKVMAEVPLFYGAVLRDVKRATAGLLSAKTEVEFWRAWMRASAKSCGRRSEHDALIELGEVAAAMLANRCDYLEQKDLKKHSIVAKSAASPWPVFVRESNDRWRFIHQAFREYVLAYGIQVGLEHPRRKTILSKESSFDYESGETYQHLRALLPGRSLGAVVKAIERQWDRIPGKVRWNNVVRNYFEAVGMIGVSGDALELAISQAKRVLQYPLDGDGHRAYFRTKYDAARCLCRLHPTSPPDYCKYATQYDWRKNPEGHKLIFGYAVRGFQVRERHAGCRQPEAFYQAPSTSHARQVEISQCLLDVIAQLSPFHEMHRDGYLLQVNASYALIRWLAYPKMAARTRRLLASENLRPKVRANLVLALHMHGDKGKDISSVLHFGQYPNSVEVDMDKLEKRWPERR